MIIPAAAVDPLRNGLMNSKILLCSLLKKAICESLIGEGILPIALFCQQHLPDFGSFRCFYSVKINTAWIF
jgi:hypothetical protein